MVTEVWELRPNHYIWLCHMRYHLVTNPTKAPWAYEKTRKHHFKQSLRGVLCFVPGLTHNRFPGPGVFPWFASILPPPQSREMVPMCPCSTHTTEPCVIGECRPLNWTRVCHIYSVFYCILYQKPFKWRKIFLWLSEAGETAGYLIWTIVYGLHDTFYSPLYVQCYTGVNGYNLAQYRD